jgi:hypothetical protein
MFRPKTFVQKQNSIRPKSARVIPSQGVALNFVEEQSIFCLAKKKTKYITTRQNGKKKILHYKIS